MRLGNQKVIAAQWLDVLSGQEQWLLEFSIALWQLFLRLSSLPWRPRTCFAPLTLLMQTSGKACYRLTSTYSATVNFALVPNAKQLLQSSGKPSTTQLFSQSP